MDVKWMPGYLENALENAAVFEKLLLKGNSKAVRVGESWSYWNFELMKAIKIPLYVNSYLRYFKQA